jgi:hypothetical protein
MKRGHTDLDLVLFERHRVAGGRILQGLIRFELHHDLHLYLLGGKSRSASLVRTNQALHKEYR